jgi:hypothetical protein
MIQLLLVVLVFCSSFGIGLSKINNNVKNVIRKPRQHQQPLDIDRKVIG